MLENGYWRYDIYDATASDCKLSLTYANPLGGKEAPNGGFEYKIKHTGISVRYDYYTAQPTVLGLCIPNGLNTFLTAFDSMDDKPQEFVIERTKNAMDAGTVCRRIRQAPVYLHIFRLPALRKNIYCVPISRAIVIAEQQLTTAL